MNNSKIFWQGTFEIWQNRNFGKIYVEFNNKKLYFIDNIQLFISYRPIIGNATLYLYCAPSEGEWITKLKSLARNLNVAKIWIYSVDPLQGLNKFFKEELFTFVINLADDKEMLWKKIGQKTRNMVRKGEKMGVSVKIAEREHEFNEWWEIYSNVARIKRFGRQNLPLVKELFKKKDLSRLFVSIKDNKIIGGAFFLINKYPMYWLGAFERRYRNYAPGHINMWEAMLFFRENGHELLDLGGVILDRENGPTRFKKSFKGKVNKGYIYEMPINKHKTRLLEFISRIKIIKRY